MHPKGKITRAQLSHLEVSSVFLLLDTALYWTRTDSSLRAADFKIAKRIVKASGTPMSRPTRHLSGSMDPTTLIHYQHQPCRGL